MSVPCFEDREELRLNRFVAICYGTPIWAETRVRFYWSRETTTRKVWPAPTNGPLAGRASNDHPARVHCFNSSNRDRVDDSTATQGGNHFVRLTWRDSGQ